MSPTLSEKDRVRLRHMLDYAREAIQFASGKSKLDFLRERQLQLAVTHLIESVGEAANHVSPETLANYLQIPWPQSLECAIGSFTATISWITLSFGKRPPQISLLL